MPHYFSLGHFIDCLPNPMLHLMKVPKGVIILPTHIPTFGKNRTQNISLSPEDSWWEKVQQQNTIFADFPALQCTEYDYDMQFFSFQLVVLKIQIPCAGTSSTILAINSATAVGTEANIELTMSASPVTTVVEFKAKWFICIRSRYVVWIGFGTFW